MKGLNQQFASNFFAAQIEANKLVQHSLLAAWHQAGGTPEHPPVSLTEDIRPQLDRIEEALIAELVETKDIRTSASCQDATAKAVRKYLPIDLLDHYWRSHLTGPWNPTAAVLRRAKIERRSDISLARQFPE